MMVMVVVIIGVVVMVVGGMVSDGEEMMLGESNRPHYRLLCSRNSTVTTRPEHHRAHESPQGGLQKSGN